MSTGNTHTHRWRERWRENIAAFNLQKKGLRPKVVHQDGSLSNTMHKSQNMLYQQRGILLLNKRFQGSLKCAQMWNGNENQFSSGMALIAAAGAAGI